MTLTTFIQNLNQLDNKQFKAILGVTKDQFETLFTEFRKSKDKTHKLDDEKKLYAILIYVNWNLNDFLVGNLILNSSRGNSERDGKTFIENVMPRLKKSLKSSGIGLGTVPESRKERPPPSSLEEILHYIDEKGVKAVLPRKLSHSIKKEVDKHKLKDELPFEIESDRRGSLEPELVVAPEKNHKKYQSKVVEPLLDELEEEGFADEDVNGRDRAKDHLSASFGLNRPKSLRMGKNMLGSDKKLVKIINKSKPIHNNSTQDESEEDETPDNSLIESDIAKLKEYKSKFKNNPASQLIGERLTLSRTYLRDTPQNFPRLEEAETYPRSDKHPRAKEAYFLPGYDKEKLKKGANAYVGNYGNLMQMLGDEDKKTNTKLSTTSGNAKLYHAELRYKNKICKYILEKISDAGGTSLIKAGFYNNYPCIMVQIKPESVCKSPQTKKPSSAAFEEWVNFLISYFIGLMNFYAVKAKLSIEMERRSSFGFMIPTMAPTNQSMRISVGIIPEEYADLIVTGLLTLDQTLNHLQTKKLEGVPNDIFYGSEKHKKYLDGKYKIYELNNLVELLFAQVEKAGRTTVQNINRSAYARDGISIQVFQQLYGKENNTPENAFLAGVKWAIEKIYVEEGKTPKLRFKQGTDINYNSKFSCSKFPLKDKDFWELIQERVNTIRVNENTIIKPGLDRVQTCIDNQKIDGLYYSLEYLNELIFIDALEQSTKLDIGDGYGSNSETEGEINNKKIFAKKIITHNGMRAIWSVIITAANLLGEEENRCRVYLKDAYYETPLGIRIIETLHQLPQITIVDELSSANTLVYDLNACVTNGSLNKSYETLDNRILILDTTSALSEDVQVHLQKFMHSRAKVVFLVDSGFKNQQLSSDKNQYGTIRIFTKDEKLREKLYAEIKENEPPLLSATSHQLRHMMKSFGAVPTMQTYIEATSDNEKNQTSKKSKIKV